MRTVVPDASVILKWVLREEGEDEGSALSVFHDFADGLLDIVTHHLWLYEVANVLVLKADLKESLRNLDFLLDQDFRVIEPFRRTAHLTIKMALDFGVTYYDASYHALAMQERAVFITADERYYRKAKTRGSILLLKDYESPVDNA
ncbi:MAG TPA: type II toxin-antitoxin system VapC family toxin [Acidobacteriota bacterium]